MSPVPPIVHLVAIAAGLLGGLWLGGAISPDLPGSEVDPGVAAASEEPIAGDGPSSLLTTANLATALNQLEEQLGADSEIVRLRIEPAQLKAEEGEGGFALADLPPSAPAQLVELIASERAKVGAADIQYTELVQTSTGPEWHVQLVSTRDDLPPPWTYGAPLDLSKLVVGGAPPKRLSP